MKTGINSFSPTVLSFIVVFVGQDLSKEEKHTDYRAQLRVDRQLGTAAIN
ncbi:hypothetical protein ES703_09145 [subsurface metagenome]